MSLEMLTIRYEKGQKGRFSGRIQALFNPSQLSYSRSVNWERIEPANVAKSGGDMDMQFKSTQPETLTVNLFFDTYGGNPRGGTVSGLIDSLLTSATRPPSVVRYTDAVMALARLDRELHRPPMCKLSWGKGKIFEGVLTSVTRNLVLFLEDGTPVRATVDCTFMEGASAGTAQNELHSADVAKHYTLQPGDTLMRLAAEFYGDASLWRRIAEANDIDNPRRLTPGRVLAIPRIS